MFDRKRCICYIIAMIKLNTKTKGDKMREIKDNRLCRFWIDEKTGQVNITSMTCDTHQRWWKETLERKFKITSQVAKDYNEDFGMYGGSIIPGQEAYSYKSELLIKPY